mgnify:CR=1 FL=1
MEIINDTVQLGDASIMNLLKKVNKILHWIITAPIEWSMLQKRINSDI